MPKPRTKRSAVREERKRKRGEQDARSPRAKRPRRTANDEPAADDEAPAAPEHGQPAADREFFGMLTDEEQEYFRRADEMLELNQFPSPDDRRLFIDSVFVEARGKELKLASSQSCSRLMERLIQLASTAQKKALFDAFAGHFLSLVRHRFASHCCEALFLRSAGAVTSELAADADASSPPAASMESLFLASLDELEGSLSFLITDRFASHTLRVILVVLSGRPLNDASAQALVRSKNKENVSVAGSAAADEQNQGARAVPASFTLAVAKIIADSTAGMDPASLRVLTRHPIGNPTLQLLLELDLALSKLDDHHHHSLLLQLLPGAPQSLADGASEASEFVNGMVYDQIGSRLVETLVTHCPGKVFKALNQNIFLPRIEGYVRNDISSYPAIKVLNRLGKDDLVTAVDRILPTLPQLVAKCRFNVLQTLLERCAARALPDDIKKLVRGLKEACGSQPAHLITTLCCLREEKEKIKDVERLARNESAIQSHGAQLLTTLLSLPGPSKGVQEALLALSPEQLLRLATASMPTVTLLTTALSTPSANSLFQKSLANAVLVYSADLSTSKFGHNLVNALAAVPSKGKDLCVPFHIKSTLMGQLAQHEPALRDSWMGRSVWRTWKGDMWKARPGDWRAWMREVDPPLQARQPVAPTRGLDGKQDAGNKVRRDQVTVEPEEAEARAGDGMHVEPEEAPVEHAKQKTGGGADKAGKKEKKDSGDKKDKKDKKRKRDEVEKGEKSEKGEKENRDRKDKDKKDKKRKRNEGGKGEKEKRDEGVKRSKKSKGERGRPEETRHE